MSNSRIEFGKVELPIKFYRSPKGYLFGVCQGISESFQFNPILVRFILLAAVFFYGFGLGVYIVLAISLPRQDQFDKAFNRRLLGVCAKISRKMNWEIGLVRSSAILLSFGSLGFAVLAYVVLYFSLEEEVIN
jgi:phage shock protein PspC (stress-responsive transcriptional regulator)